MTNAETVFVGLKIKRDTIDIAFAPNNCCEDDRFYTTIPAKNDILCEGSGRVTGAV